MAVATPHVFVGVPNRGAVVIGCARGLGATGRGHEITLHLHSTSLLCLGFNSLWCEALNRRKDGVTHFAMLHDDIEPDNDWVDTLLRVQAETGADVVSVVNAIKDQRGVTSTAVYDPATKRRKRLTVRELDGLPETFGPEQFPGCELLVNTGCWLARLDKPWAERVCFRTRDAVLRRDDGTFIADCLSEDWQFSRDLIEWDVPYVATRAVKTRHHGSYAYPNGGGWGSYDTDEDA